MDAYDFSAPLLSGETVGLDRYRGQVLLVVNTASQCVFTPQYKGLQALHEQFRDRGFAVLGFPCNQFREQEPGSSGEIAAFCQRSYGITFPVFARVDVNGPRAHPLFRYLKAHARGVLWTQRIKWNFTKFLVARDGSVVRRYGPSTAPEKIAADIEALLANGGA